MNKNTLPQPHDLLDFYAVRAPQTIPGWYQPLKPLYDGPAAPVIPEKFSDEQKAILNAWLDDPAYDLEDEFSWFQAAREAYAKARSQWKILCDMERYYRWPYFWAAQMLTTRDMMVADGELPRSPHFREPSILKAVTAADE